MRQVIRFPRNQSTMKAIVALILLSIATCGTATSCYRCLLLQGFGLEEQPNRNLQEAVLKKAGNILNAPIENITACGTTGLSITERDLFSCDGDCYSMYVKLGLQAGDSATDGTVSVHGCIGDYLQSTTQNVTLDKTACGLINADTPASNSKSISASIEIGCSTCAEDGCNSGVMAKAGFLLIAIPILIAKLLL